MSREPPGAIFDFSGNSPYAIVIAPNGKKISGDPSFVMGFKPEDEQFNPLRLREGRWAAGDGEVVLDASTADGHGVKIGDTVKIAALTPSAPFKVVGIGRFGKVSSLGGATMAVFDVPVAQRLLQKDGKLDVVSVAAADGVSAEALAQRLQPFASSTVQVQTADERAADDQAGIGLFVDIITWILRGFGGVVLFVGGFVIVNTLSITVAQRTRELGTLRLIGATRTQVRRAVVLESLVIGVLASLVGVAVGVALAVGLRALLGSFDLTFPETALVISPQTLAVGFLIGVIVTVIAGLLPAARATRISPVEAVREGVTHERGRMARIASVLGALLLVGGIALLALGMVKGGSLGVAGTLASSLGGMLLLFIGAAMLVPVAVPVIARIVGWPAARFAGIPGRLARDNAIRNPGRTASTAAALMIGIALVSAIAVLGRSLKVTAVEAVESQIGSSHVLQSETGWESLPPAAAKTIADRARREGAQLRPLRPRQDRQRSRSTSAAIDPATIDGPYRFTWQEGSKQSLAALGTTGALVRDDLAEQKDLVVGDRIAVLSAAGKTRSYVVRGVFAPARLDSLLGHVVITQQAFDASFPQPADVFTFVDLAPGTDTAALAARLKVFPDAVLRTTPAMIEKRQGDIDGIVTLLTMLLVLAVITALLGMVNALALAVIERTREIGALRAVGMTRQADAAHGAPRGGDDVADRRSGGAPARDPRRLGRDPRASRRFGVGVPPAGEAARRVRGRRGGRGRARGGAAGEAGGEARRAEGAAVRVDRSGAPRAGRSRPPRNDPGTPAVGDSGMEDDSTETARACEDERPTTIEETVATRSSRSGGERRS